MSFLTRARSASPIATAVLVAGLLAACDGGEPSTPREDAQPRESAQTAAAIAEPQTSQSRPAKTVWSRRIEAVSQPVAAGPAVLVLAKAGSNAIELVSLDRTSGRENFRMPFHPGGLPPGVAMTPRVTRTDAGRRLAIVRRYEPGTPGPALVAVDVRTGAVVRSTSAVVIDDYDACSDGRDVCWSGFESRPGPLVESPFGMIRDNIPGSAPMRWDLESGRTSEKTLHEGAMRVGEPDLFLRGEGRLATLVRLPGTRRTAWSQSVSLVVRDGADPRYGWTFDYDKDANVYTGSLGQPPAANLLRRFRRGEKVELDYTKRYLTVGIDGRTGEQLWRRRGANPWCSLLRDAPEVAARTLCVLEGSSVQQEGRDPKDKNLAVTLEGIDPRTGEVLWSHRLDGADAKTAYTDKRAPIAPYGVVLPSDEGPVALDMRDGQLQQVGDDVVLLCSGGPDDVTVYGIDRTAGTLYRSCTPDGRPANGRLSAFGASAIDGSGRTRFVAMEGRVVAFKL
jgi:outer membrane protein assembly factor BamB